MKPVVIQWLLFLAPLVQGFGVQSSISQEIKPIRRGIFPLFLSNDLLDLNESIEGVSNIAIGAWVPVGSVSCLSGLDPTCLELFGHRLVVWQKSPAHWSVMMDECPHRFAPLSQGRVDPITKCIECPYHGWQFHDNGTLACIPQLEQDKELPQRLSAEAFPAHVVGDLIFAFLPSYMHGESFPINLLPEDYYRDLPEFLTPQVTFYTRDLPYSWDFLVENLMDGPAHLAYAHNTIGSKREDAAPVPMKIRVSNFTHFDYQSTYIRFGEQRYRRFGFQRPFLTHQETPRGRGGEWKRTLLFFCVPVREGSCRVITNFDTLVRATDPDAPDWKVHLKNNRFFDSDIWIHDAEFAARSKSRDVPKYLYPSSCDASVQGFRRWWTQYGYSSAPPNSFGPASFDNLQRLSRQQQMDPWQGHTNKCTKCRSVLEKAKNVKLASLLVGAIGAIFTSRRHPLLSCVFLGIGVFARIRAHKLVVSLEGEQYPSNVDDRTFASAD